MQSKFKNSIAFLIGLIIASVLLEIFLNFYNPFPFRVQGNEIILPVNQEFAISNEDNPKLDKEVIHTKNSLGFRGEELPEYFEKYLSMITVGGSTTECFNLNDGKDWPALLQKKLEEKYDHVWINNAGFNGHSTFGHLILLNDYISKVKPKYVLYLVGCNDVGRDDLNKFDQMHIKSEYLSWRNWIYKNSELAGLVINIIRTYNAYSNRLAPGYLKFEEAPTVEMSEREIENEVEKQEEYLRGYRSRLNTVVENTRKWEMEPILITQPCALGEGIDPKTGVDLEKIKVCGMHGKTYWQILEQYNEVTRKIGMRTNTMVIDLANKLPKNTIYFYDCLHFTNTGSEKVAEIIFQDLTIKNLNAL